MRRNNGDDKDFQGKHRTEWRDFLWSRFLEKLTKTRTIKDASEIMNSLFSEYEKKVVTKRLAALALIKSGRGVREIGRVLWMSTSTINALKKSLFSGQKIYQSQRSFKTVKKITPSRILIKKSWLEELMKDVDLWELLKNPPRPTGMGLKGGWRKF